MGLFGPLNGTNNAVSPARTSACTGASSAPFLSLLTAIAFFSLGGVPAMPWSAAPGAWSAWKSELNLGLAYGPFAVLVLTVCIYGFRFMLLVNRIAVAASPLFLLGLFASPAPSTPPTPAACNSASRASGPPSSAPPCWP